jgi:hypothetical protein
VRTLLKDKMDHLLSCKCGELLVKSSPDGVTKVRGKIMLFKGDQGFVVCKGCGAETQIPVKLDSTELQAKSPKLYVAKQK